MRLVVDHPSLEAFLVQVSLAVVPAVETLCVKTGKPVHSGGEPFATRFDQQVIVRSHQAPGVQLPAESLDGLIQQGKEGLPVEVVGENEDPARSARGHVEEAVLGKMRSRSPRHAVRDGSAAELAKPAPGGTCHTFVTKDEPSSAPSVRAMS